MSSFGHLHRAIALLLDKLVFLGQHLATWSFGSCLCSATGQVILLNCCAHIRQRTWCWHRSDYPRLAYLDCVIVPLLDKSSSASFVKLYSAIVVLLDKWSCSPQAVQQPVICWFISCLCFTCRQIIQYGYYIFFVLTRMLLIQGSISSYTHLDRHSAASQQTIMPATAFLCADTN